jgi:prepilin-type N-terminal cleavage/methylation domain-containing protein
MQSNFETGTNSRARRAFSLIELLITMVLLLILVMMFHSRGSRSYQQTQLAACSKNLQTIHIALTTFAGDNNGIFPHLPGAQFSEEALSLLVPTSTTVTEIFVCPGSKDKAPPPAEPFAGRKISYAYYMGWSARHEPGNPLLSDRQVNDSPKRQGEPVFSADGKAPADNHEKFGGNILFINGDVKKSRPEASFDLLFPSRITLLNPRSK